MKTRFSLTTATALVVANMVGTGVFTSLGFQVGRDAAGNPVLSSGLALILLWILGGAVALFGALTYSEAGVLFPRCGGEYHYLTRMYHPAVGFLSGWIAAKILKKLNLLRVPPEVELDGLDAAEYRPDIHVPEFAVSDDLVIEPDGSRSPADRVQAEAARDLVRG